MLSFCVVEHLDVITYFVRQSGVWGQSVVVRLVIDVGSALSNTIQSIETVVTTRWESQTSV